MNKAAAGIGMLGYILQKLTGWFLTKTHSSGKRRHIVAGAVAMLVGFMLLMTVADRLWAAIELAYYRGAATNSAVYLEWATVREVNLSGFEILCKRVSEPDTAFHPIGSRIALGRPSTYNFDVTSGLIPGERYCFRLREVTSDGTPGEVFDLCGYGLGLTPPPTSDATVVVSIPVTLTPTVVSVEGVPGIDPAPTLGPTQDPLLTLTPTEVLSPTSTPLIDQADSPLPTPTLTFTPNNAQQQQQQTDSNQASSPLPTPLGQDSDAAAAQISPTVTSTPTATPFATETPTATPTVDVTATEVVTGTSTVTATMPVTEEQPSSASRIDRSGPDDPGESGSPVAPDAAVAMAEATPTSLYVVVTATPTPEEALAVLPPTLTPWPTVVPTASFSLDSLLVPSTQNLMVGLLCLIFLSASGLGALGLVTSVLYMRSQTRRDRLPGPVYERRRY